VVDVLLIQPPVRDYYLTAKRTFPYGLACVAAALRRAGFSVEILDALATRRQRVRARPDAMAYLDAFYGVADRSPFALFHTYRHHGLGFDRIGELARESGAFLVGISSLFTPYIDEALAVAEAVKRHHPGARTVLGGHHPTTLPNDVMRCSAVDFAVRGEGEVALPALARALASEGPVDSVPGLVYRGSDGELVVGPPALAEELDALPATDLVDRGFYAQRDGARTVVVTSRGCPLRCSYCAVGARSGVPYRRRSVDAVAEEIETEVRQHGVVFVDFEDENLTLDRSWFLSLLSRLRERLGDHPLELRAMNGLLPHTLDAEVVRAMKGAGFRALNLSLGSSCQEQLRRFHRPDERAAFDRALDLAADNDLVAVGYLVAAAPSQHAHDSVADLVYLGARRVLVGLSIYYPAPGSDDYERCEREGLLPGHWSLMRSTALPIEDRTTRLEAATLLRLARVLNFMKQLLDDGEELPAPDALDPGARLDPADRRTSGRALLAGLLADETLRGLSPDGEVFAHEASTSLVAAFLNGLRGVGVTGTRTDARCYPGAGAAGTTD